MCSCLRINCFPLRNVEMKGWAFGLGQTVWVFFLGLPCHRPRTDDDVQSCAGSTSPYLEFLNWPEFFQAELKFSGRPMASMEKPPDCNYFATQTITVTDRYRPIAWISSDSNHDIPRYLRVWASQSHENKYVRWWYIESRVSWYWKNLGITCVISLSDSLYVMLPNAGCVHAKDPVAIHIQTEHFSDPVKTPSLGFRLWKLVQGLEQPATLCCLDATVIVTSLLTPSDFELASKFVVPW